MPDFTPTEVAGMLAEALRFMLTTYRVPPETLITLQRGTTSVGDLLALADVASAPSTETEIETRAAAHRRRFGVPV